MKNLLITGNAASLASTLCQQLCRAFHVTVAAPVIPDTALGKGIEAQPLSKKRALKDVFLSRPFDAVIFLGTRGEQASLLDGEADMLSSALALALRHKAERVLYATGGELCFADSSAGERGLKLRVMEQLCGAYRQMGLNVTVLKLPLLFGPGETDTLIGRMILQALRGGTAEIPFPAEEQADFLLSAEAARLVEALLASEQPPDSLYTARGGETLTGGELKALFELMGCPVALGASAGSPPMDGEAVLQRFGFAPMARLSVELHALYASFKEMEVRHQGWFRRALAFLRRHPALAKGASLLLGYAALEYLLSLQSAGQFPALDIRLIYVALAAAAHGLQTGLLAVLLACFSLGRGYGAQGMTVFDLLKDWRPWMPIAALLLTGTAAGLARDRGGREAVKAREDAQALEKRCAYLQELYKQSLLAKNPPPAPAGENIEEQLSRLREGQEKLMQEWLTLMGSARPDIGEEAQTELSGLPEQARPALAQEDLSAYIPEEADEETAAAAFPQDADTMEAPDQISESYLPPSDLTPDSYQLPDDLTNDLYPPLESSGPYAPSDASAYDVLPEYGFQLEEAGEPKGEQAYNGNAAARDIRKPSRNGEGKSRLGTLPQDSPLANMTPSERRRMLEAMQVRAGKASKRKKDR